MNPFLSKPLRKVQPGAAPLKNSSAEHRPSRYINPPKKIIQDKKGPDLQKNKNQSPKKQTTTNNINIINKFSKEDDKKNNNMKKENTSKKLNNVQKESNKQVNKNFEKKEEKKENTVKNNDTNLIIDNNISINLTKSDIEFNQLIFTNNDEILEYIKKQLKDGKIKDIKSKLEMPSNDFTGFTLSKKKQGYTIYEIELEEDIDKVNETFKNQKVEIGKKPIQIVLEEQIKALKKEAEKKSSI